MAIIEHLNRLGSIANDVERGGMATEAKEIHKIRRLIENEMWKMLKKYDPSGGQS